MKISVIISTYERPDALELVLRGYAVQTDRDVEILIADDGSGAGTASRIRSLRDETGLTIVHVRHADDGFRKCDILNRAIVAAGGDYLLFTDGDCIPRNDLIAVHRRLARPDRFVAGGYLKLPADVTARVTAEDVASGRIGDVAWLRSIGWRPRRRALRLLRSRTLSALLDAVTPTRTHFHGNNASVWKDALFEVNGFEGEMGYGGLDRALGYRLVNAGVRGIQARHRAVAFHLHHAQPWKDREVMRRNRERMAAIRREGTVRATRGISELAPDPELTIER